MNQFMSKKMSVDIYKVCWLFLHFIFDVIEWVVRLFYAVKRKLTVGNRRENLLDDNILIESAREYLTKIPSHLVIILGTESSPDFKILSKFIFWSLSAGIRNISFYDHKGTLAFLLMKNFTEENKIDKFDFDRYFASEKLQNFRLHCTMEKGKRQNSVECKHKRHQR